MDDEGDSRWMATPLEPTVARDFSLSLYYRNLTFFSDKNLNAQKMKSNQRNFLKIASHVNVDTRNPKIRSFFRLDHNASSYDRNNINLKT